MSVAEHETTFKRSIPGPTRRIGDGVIIPLGIVGVAVVFFLLWFLVSLFYGYFVPSPASAFDKLIGGFTAGWIVAPALSTGRIIGISFLIALFVGFGGGLFFGLNKFWREVLEPMVVAVYVLPKIVLFPLFLLIFGLGMKSLIGLASVSALFPILMNVAGAMREMNPVYQKVGRSFNIGTVGMILKVYTPAIALPLITGLRVALSLCFISTVLGEMVASDMGLGQELFRSYSILDVPKMYGIMLLLFAAAFIINMVPWVIEKRLRNLMD